MNQYLREWRIDIDGDKFIEGGDGRQFRVVFNVSVSPGNAQSFADIRIYNLSKGSVINQDATITLYAGYKNKVDVIFTGTVRNVLPERDGASTATRILCRSGAPVKYRGSANGSYGESTKLVDVLRDLAKSWPLELIMDEKQFDDNPAFPSGYVTDGDIPTIIEDLSKQFNFDWVQDRGTLTISRIKRDRTTPIFEVNQFTGMVGMPEVTRGPDGLGVTVNMRINPSIRPFSRINVKSEFSTFNTGNIFIQQLSGDARANGIYNVFAMSYSGDTHGDVWDLTVDGIRSGADVVESGADINANQSSGALVWGARVSREFRARVREIESNLGINADWLMSVMAFETGGSFSPSVTNAAGSGATGLIQFIPSTARLLGTSTAALSRMSAVSQLDFVERYFEDYASRIRGIGDTYLAVLWPAGIGKTDSWVMWTKSGQYQREYAQNAGLDSNHNDEITRGEAVSAVNKSFMDGQKYRR